jgi:hypothetical protein
MIHIASITASKGSDRESIIAAHYARIEHLAEAQGTGQHQILKN